MTKVTTTEAVNLIKSEGNQFFTVTFTKKNGEERVLNGRRGVAKYANGEGLKFNPSDYNLLTVYDVQAKGYRMINCEGITHLRIDGINFEIEENLPWE